MATSSIVHNFRLTLCRGCRGHKVNFRPIHNVCRMREEKEKARRERESMREGEGPLVRPCHYAFLHRWGRLLLSRPPLGQAREYPTPSLSLSLPLSAADSLYSLSLLPATLSRLPLCSSLCSSTGTDCGDDGI